MATECRYLFLNVSTAMFFLITTIPNGVVNTIAKNIVKMILSKEVFP